MRQGQQNRRGRGRNNRKGQSPLTRSFESNGPDMKIRGTPSHVAEKYMSLARDAQLSGDPVLAENYLQHAEHYNRIILTYREQQGGDAANGNSTGQRNASSGEAAEGAADVGGVDSDNVVANGQPGMVQPGDPQPNSSRNEGGRRPRSPRARRSDNATSGDQPEAGRGQSANGGRENRQPRRRPQKASNAPEGEEFSGQEQPDFLRRPVRRPRRDAGSGVEDKGTSDAPAPAVAIDEANE